MHHVHFKLNIKIFKYVTNLIRIEKRFSTIKRLLIQATLNLDVYSIRTLYPNKIIVSNKLLGLSRLGLKLGFGSGLILYAWNDNSNKYWNYQTL